MVSREIYQHMPIEGEKHFTTSVLIISEEASTRVLLVHHQKLGVWMPPGGHGEILENPLQTGIREVKEETGVDITPYLPQTDKLDDRAVALPIPQYFLEELIERHGDQPAHVHLDFIYVVKIPYRKPLLEKDEHHAIRWFSKQELQNESPPLFDNVRMILTEIL